MSLEPRGIDGQPLRGLEVEYEIVRELGRGGSSVVYLAVERELEREVAIKTIHPMFAADADASARLAREARTLARLQHPNIVTFYGVRHLADGGLAVVMQYVRGERLKDRIRTVGPMPVEETRRILADVARALGHAHRHHVVHRDIKPENIFLDSDLGIARLSDFGIARTWDGEGSLTQSGLAIGTPAYMAPEQIDGAPLDGRSDLYALGMVGYEMLSGRRPWDGQNLYGIIYKQKHEALPGIETLRPDVPESLRLAISVALEKERERRWSNAEAFLGCIALPSDVLSPASVARGDAEAESGYPALAAAIARLEATSALDTTMAAQEVAPESPAALEPDSTDARHAPIVDEGDDALTIPYRPADVVAPETANVVAEIERAITPVGGPGKPTKLATPKGRRRRALVVAAVLVLCLGGGLGAISLIRQAAGARVAQRAARKAAASATTSASLLPASVKSAPPASAMSDSVPVAEASPADQSTSADTTPSVATPRPSRPEQSSPAPRRVAATPIHLPPPPAIKLEVDSGSIVGGGGRRLLGIRADSAPAAEAEPLRARSAPAAPAPAPVTTTTAASPPADITQAPTFTPFTVAPELQNRAEIARMLGRISSGEPGGATHARLVVWVFIDPAGVVQSTQVKQSTGRTALDRSALQVARSMRFTPALNGDRRVGVWVAVPIEFTAR